MAVVGKILFIILVLLLILLLLLLFFPISYRILLNKQPEDLKISAKVSWLFGFVRVLFDYPEPRKLMVKLLFITLIGKEKSKTKALKLNNASNSKKPNGRDNTIMDNPESFEKPADQENSGSEASREDVFQKLQSNPDSESDIKSAEELQNVSQFETVNESVNETQNEPVNEPIEEPIEEPANGPINESAKGPINDEPVKGSEKESKKGKKDLKTLYEQTRAEFDFYYGLWEREETKTLMNAFLARLLHILKNLLPRKVKGILHFGAASPDVTGYVFGWYCVAQALYPKRLFLELEPDFENEILECDLLIKGHFTVFTLLLDGLRVILDKRLWRLKKTIEQHRNGDTKQKPSKSKKK